MKVYIDVGHGGADPGAVNGNLIEHQMAAVTAAAFAQRLREYGLEVKTESGDLTLQASAQAANSWGADLLLSFHYNAGGGARGEVIKSIRPGSDRLAGAVADGLKAAGQTNVKTYSRLNSAGNADYFGILRHGVMPAVIVEPCFIDNVQDRKLADTPEKQAAIGVKIADALAQTCGYAPIEEGNKMQDVKVKIGSDVIAGVLIDGVTYVPLRDFVQAITPKVGWDAQTKTASVQL